MTLTVLKPSNCSHFLSLTRADLANKEFDGIERKSQEAGRLTYYSGAEDDRHRYYTNWLDSIRD